MKPEDRGARRKNEGGLAVKRALLRGISRFQAFIVVAGEAARFDER
jgi:hypothetical protein